MDATESLPTSINTVAPIDTESIEPKPKKLEKKLARVVNAPVHKRSPSRRRHRKSILNKILTRIGSLENLTVRPKHEDETSTSSRSSDNEKAPRSRNSSAKSTRSRGREKSRERHRHKHQRSHHRPRSRSKKLRNESETEVSSTTAESGETETGHESPSVSDEEGSHKVGRKLFGRGRKGRKRTPDSGETDPAAQDSPPVSDEKSDDERPRRGSKRSSRAHSGRDRAKGGRRSMTHSGEEDESKVQRRVDPKWSVDS